MDRATCALWSASLSDSSPFPGSLEKHAGAIHQAYQAWQDSQLERNRIAVHCGPGCSSCCNQYPLGIHAFEILALFRWLEPRPDFPSLIAQCRARRDNYQAWTEFVKISYPPPRFDDGDREALAQEHDFDDGQPCPFLDHQGSCGIHQARPLTCRMFLSRSPAAFCTSQLNTAPEADQFTLPPEEAVTLRLWKLDRLMDCWGHDGSLFGSLVALHDHLQRKSP
ncbi:MAG: hypothetical protein RL318_3125 [Fibrobacterota bacterium]